MLGESPPPAPPPEKNANLPSLTIYMTLSLLANALEPLPMHEKKTLKQGYQDPGSKGD